MRVVHIFYDFLTAMIFFICVWENTFIVYVVYMERKFHFHGFVCSESLWRGVEFNEVLMRLLLC